MKIPKQCMTCRHKSKGSATCSAFPDYPGIPRQIYLMEIDHRKPYQGDNGIQWEPVEPGTKHPFDEDSKSG